MGINPLAQLMQNAGLSGINRLASNPMFPQGSMNNSQYATSSQMPASAEEINSGYEPQTDPYTGALSAKFAKGGLAYFEEGGTAEDPFLGNKDFQNLSWEELNDKDRLQSLNELKAIDPQAYNSQLMGMLSNSIKNQYNINADYEPTWKQFAALKDVDPAQWHKEQLGFLGHQQGWQVGQNTSERNAAGLPVIQDEIEQAKKAGLNDDEIQKILGGSSQAANIQNQQRIINQQQAGNGPLGMTTKDYLTVAAILGSGAAAAYFAPAMAATGAGTGSGIGLSASSIPSLTTGLELGAGAGAGAGAGGFGLTGASTGGIGLTAASVPSLATGLEVGTAGALGGAGAAGSSGLPSLKEAYNAYKYANQANKLLNGLTGGQQTGYGINPNPAAIGYNAFDPGVRVTGLSELSSAYEKTPWANMMPEITLSKLSEFAPERELAEGGKTDSNDIFKNLTEKEKRLLELELMAQSLTKRPGEEHSGMMVPQGLLARLGAATDLGENSRLRAGLSGLAMALPGQHGVTAMPGSMDIGYSTKAGPGDLDLSAFRSINAIPGKGYAQGVNARYSIPFVEGGDISHLGGYSDGGRLLKGPGDGMSDNIPASIGNKQPARLADGEFVIPADVVSHLGNGSTDAGAKQLYAMMDKVRSARTGSKKQGKQINPNKFLPKG